MHRTSITLLLSLALVACARGRAAAPPAADAVTVRVASVSIDRLAPPVTAIGTLGPKEEVTLSFQLGSHARGVGVRAGLADRDVVRIRRGDRAVVRFDALPDRSFDGAVTEIAGAADPLTGTYRVEVTVPAAAGLASGLIGRVEIRPAGAR